MPLPPATVRLSTARWRRPRRKFGTATVRSIAAFRVTVRITGDHPLSPSDSADQPTEKHRCNQYHARGDREGIGCSATKPASLVEAARGRDVAAGEQRHGARPQPVDADRGAAELGAAADRAAHPGAARRLRLRPSALRASRPSASGRPAAAARRRSSGSPGAASSLPCAGARLRRWYWRKPHSSSSKASEKRVSSVGASIATAISWIPWRLARADQHVARLPGVAGLHPGHPGRHFEQLVDRLDVARRVDAAQRRFARVGDLGEGGDLQQFLGQRREVEGARVVALLVEPDRVRVVGVGQAERRGVAVHLGDELLLRARRVDRQGVGGVAGAAAGSARRAGRGR